MNGIKESKEDDDADLVADLLRLGLHIDGFKYIEEVSRIGRLAENKVRPSRQRIKNINGKQEILRKTKDLKDSLSYKKVYLTPDLTRKQLEMGNELSRKLKI